MKGVKQGGYVPPMARPADTGKASTLAGQSKSNMPDVSLAPGTEDMSGGNVGRGTLPVNGSKGTKSQKVKGVSTNRHLVTGTAKGKGGSSASGAKYKGQSGGGYTPGFGK